MRLATPMIWPMREIGARHDATSATDMSPAANERQATKDERLRGGAAAA